MMKLERVKYLQIIVNRENRIEEEIEVRAEVAKILSEATMCLYVVALLV